MSIASLLPVRIGLLDRPARKHRAVDEVTRLRGFLAGAHELIRGMQLQVDDMEQKYEAAAAKQGEAEELVVKQLADLDDVTSQRDALAEEVAWLRNKFGPQLAAEANATRMTVPCGYRDTTAIEDQATGPIDVRALWQARDAGLLGAVTDPGQVTTR